MNRCSESTQCTTWTPTHRVVPLHAAAEDSDVEEVEGAAAGAAGGEEEREMVDVESAGPEHTVGDGCWTTA